MDIKELCNSRKGGSAILILSIVLSSFKCVHKNEPLMNVKDNGAITAIDNSKKSILARGCDPIMSLEASKAIPPLIGNPEYIPTTSDNDFIEKLKSRKWSVVFFAPGACRFSAAKMPIPGGISETNGWTLKDYKDLVYKYQGDDIQIVETQDERQTVGLLTEALGNARETK